MLLFAKYGSNGKEACNHYACTPKDISSIHIIFEYAESASCFKYFLYLGDCRYSIAEWFIKAGALQSV
jgi:hypothetical protein